MNGVTRICNKLNSLISDIKNGTSHSVDFLLSSEIEETLSINGIKNRKFFAPLLRMIFSFKTKYKLTMDNRENLPKEKGKIFVVNHRQADDIVLAANAIRESGYFLFGNANLALETLDGLGLWGYGVFLLDRNDKLSRMSSTSKMKYVLEHGGNIIVYSEGYWNLADDGLSDERHGADDHNSESWLIQDINVGVVRLAKETGAVMVPTILHYDETHGKKCYADIGKPLSVLDTDDIFSKKDEFVMIMQTMYYRLMEKYSSYNREALEAKGKTLKEQWEELKQELVSACDIDRIGYKLDLKNEKLIGKAKVLNPIVTNEEVFGRLDNITYNQDNAYLLSKRLTGRRK